MMKLLLLLFFFSVKDHGGEMMENGPADDKVPLLPELESTNKYLSEH